MTIGATMTVQEYEQLFRYNYERLYYHSLDIVHDEDVARDVVSDVYVNVWRLRETIASDTALSYLYTSVRNRSLDQLRHHSRHVPLIEEVIQELEHFSDTDWEEYETRIRALKAELDRQPERVRRVLYMRFYEQKSNQEVAEQLGITVDGVKKIIQRSFAQMRVSLGKKMLKFVPLLLFACMN
jgi:RNA polymerase sigma-70 factor (ECF subfamily)